MQVNKILSKLKSMGSQRNREGMARFGINVKNAYGTSVVNIRKLKKSIKRNHELADKLWKTGNHEARMLAAFIDEPDKVTEKQMDSWVKDFDSWDICDQCCSNLFDKTPFAYKKAVEWTGKKEEFVRRAGFTMMAVLAVHDKEAKDSDFYKFFPLIKKYSTDERNFVRKAINWALRQIGKRNKALNRKAIKLAKEIQKIDSKSARWIANDAIRELESDAVKKKMITPIKLCLNICFGYSIW